MEKDLFELINFNEEERFLGMPVSLFDELQDMVKNKKLKQEHAGVTYSYLYFITYMSAFGKYKDFIPSVKQIKEILGYRGDNDTLNYILKKNGILDTFNLTISINDFSIQSIDNNLRFLSNIYENVNNYKKSRGVNVNTTSKIPLFVFQNKNKYRFSEDKEVIIESNHNSEFTEIDFKVFSYCMEKKKELSCNAFYLYSYLKYNSKKNGDGYKISYKNLEKEFPMSTDTLIKLSIKMREYNMIGISEDVLTVNEYYVNNYESFYIDGKNEDIFRHKEVTPSVNDLWTTNPKVAKLLLNHEEGYKYTQTSSFKTDWLCPNCNEVIRNRAIYQIHIHGLSCPRCGGKSYNEKLMYMFLSRLQLRFEYEFNDTWSNRKRYDFYIPYLNCIIETHGGQHYFEGGFEFRGGDSLEDVKENDQYKYELAMMNNINKYIVIDCRYSNFEWIKNSILNSELNELFNLDNFDWDDFELEVIKYAGRPNVSIPLEHKTLIDNGGIIS